MVDIAASIVGIVSAGTKVTLVLSQLAADVGSAGTEVKMISSEINSFCAIMNTLGETLDKLKASPYYAHCADMIKDMTDASLEMFAEILIACECTSSMTKGKESRFGILGRVQWAVFHKPKIAVLRAALEAYKSNITLMLTTLNTAEKVTRRVSLADTPEVIAEDEKDRSLLQSLQQEHRASLIGLEEAERLLKEESLAGNEEWTAPNTSRSFTAHAANPPSHGKNNGTQTWTDTLVCSARQEIESFRNSLPDNTPFNTDDIQEKVTRYSKRLSHLLTNDQNRISHRWSTISLSEETEDHSDFTSYINNLNTADRRFPAPLSNHQKPREKSSKSPSVTNPKTRPAKDAEDAVTTPVNEQEEDFKSDKIYLIAQNTISMYPIAIRKMVLNALMHDLCTVPEHESCHDSTIAATAPSSMAPKITDDLDERIPAQYRLQVRKINKLMKDQLRAFYSRTESTVPNLVIDLSFSEIEYLPEQITEVIKGRLDGLNLACNSLTQLPSSIASFQYMTKLDLRANAFEKIPDAIFDLLALEDLNLSHNRLRAIPGKISKLTALKILSVSKNEIKGLPFAMGYMKTLNVLRYDEDTMVFPSTSALGGRLSKFWGSPSDTERLEIFKTDCVKAYLREHGSSVSTEEARAILGLRNWSTLLIEPPSPIRDLSEYFPKLSPPKKWTSRIPESPQSQDWRSDSDSPALTPDTDQSVHSKPYSSEKQQPTTQHRRSRSQEPSIKIPSILVSTSEMTSRRRSHLGISADEKSQSTVVKSPLPSLSLTTDFSNGLSRIPVPQQNPALDTSDFGPSPRMLMWPRNRVQVSPDDELGALPWQ